MVGALFITAPDADVKFVNRLLLHLRDWEYGQEGSRDYFHLLTTTTAPPSGLLETELPVTDFSVNEWAGKSLHDVEKFLLEHMDQEGVNLNLSNVVVVDEQSMRDSTCIMTARDCDDEDDFRILDTFKKVRVPWEETYITWCNLEIANMNFEDFCNQDKGDTGDGWWEWGCDMIDDSEKREITEKRDASIKSLATYGYA